MALLRQRNSPAANAVWTVHTYSREYKVVNNLVEVDIPDHIDFMLGQGFEIVTEDDLNKPVRALGVIRHSEDAVEPQGTQTVTVEDAEEPSDAPVVEEAAETESTPAPEQAQEAPPTAPKKRGRGRPRKNS